jgi:hypothetical protein
MAQGSRCRSVQGLAWSSLAAAVAALMALAPPAWSAPAVTSAPSASPPTALGTATGPVPSPARAASPAAPEAGTSADAPTPSTAAADMNTTRGVVVLTADRDVLNLGLDKAAELTLVIEGPDAAQAVPGRVRASVGTVEPLVAVPNTTGRFTAAYRAPAEIRPQAAILAVEVLLAGGRRAFGVTRLRLDAPTQFPLRTSPDAHVTIEVDGHVYGPVLADPAGQVLVPIVVPPGVATATARAVNQFGVAKETQIDLQSTDFQRIVLLADPTGAAGDTLLAEVWAVEPTGQPASPEEMDLGATAGHVRRLGGEPGHARFLVSLPKLIGAGRMSLIASMNDGSSTEVEVVAMRPGAPVEMALSAAPDRLRVGSGLHASVAVVIRDRFGNRVEPRGLGVSVNGAPYPVQVAPDVAVVYIPAPEHWAPSGPDGVVEDQLVVRAELAGLVETTVVWLTGGDPVAASLTTDRDRLPGTGRDAAELRLRVRDAEGAPASAGHVHWTVAEPGQIDLLPSAHLGNYRARYVPPRTLHDHRATVVATIDDRFSSLVRMEVEAVPPRTLTARVGILTNLSTTIGPAVFVDALWPWWQRPEPVDPERGRGGTGGSGSGVPTVTGRGGRSLEGWGGGGPLRLLAAGLSIGYLHSEQTTKNASSLEGVHVELNQFPVLAIARLRVPVDCGAEVFLSGMAGWTLASASISANEGMGATISNATAHGTTLGLGAEATLPLDPGQLVFGARYLTATLGRTSDGDTLRGNSLGLICDLGFKLGF